MYQHTFKMWVMSGILLLLTTHSVQAVTLSYQGVGTQNQDLASEIRVTSQVGNLFFLRITGGMPDISALTQAPYVKNLHESDTEKTVAQAVAIFSSPFLYIFAAGDISQQKVLFDVNYTYVLLQQDETHFQLSHYFRAGELCTTQSCDDSGLLCGETECQAQLEKVSFDKPVIYDVHF